MGTKLRIKKRLVLCELKSSKLFEKGFEKQLALKYFFASKSDLCLCTKRTHCFRVEGFVGKQCMLIPGVSALFVRSIVWSSSNTEHFTTSFRLQVICIRHCLHKRCEPALLIMSPEVEILYMAACLMCHIFRPN